MPIATDNTNINQQSIDGTITDQTNESMVKLL